MSEPWIHSMNGVPWTIPKMQEAALLLRRRASIGFVFGADKLSDLVELDELLFAKRPDLILNIGSTASKGEYTEEWIDTLAGLKHIKALHLNIMQSQNLSKLQVLHNLDFLRIRAAKSISLEFLTAFKQLSFLELDGKFKDLSPLSECDHLRSLILKATIHQLNFAEHLPLEYMLINNCSINCEIDARNFPMLKMLKLSAINKMEDISSIGEFKQLHFLGLALSRVKQLCDFSHMEKLKELELVSMKSLQEIHPLQMPPHLEHLVLTEINPALKAEAFASLAAIPELRQLDFQFIDFNKGRIAALRKIMIEAGKEHILLENIPSEKRKQSMEILHLSRILR